MWLFFPSDFLLTFEVVLGGFGGIGGKKSLESNPNLLMCFFNVQSIDSLKKLLSKNQTKSSCIKTCNL